MLEKDFLPSTKFLLQIFECWFGFQCSPRTAAVHISTLSFSWCGKRNEAPIMVFTWATSAPNHAAVLHHRAGNRKLPGMATNVVKNTRTGYWFERSFHPGGVSLITSASYKWIIGANILSHLSRKSIYKTPSMDGAIRGAHIANIRVFPFHSWMASCWRRCSLFPRWTIPASAFVNKLSV